MTVRLSVFFSGFISLGKSINNFVIKSPCGPSDNRANKALVVVVHFTVDGRETLLVQPFARAHSLNIQLQKHRQSTISNDYENVCQLRYHCNLILHKIKHCTSCRNYSHGKADANQRERWHSRRLKRGSPSYPDAKERPANSDHPEKARSPSCGRYRIKSDDR